MTPQTAFVRKIVYLAAIAVLLVPLFLLSHPATGDVKEQKGRPGGLLPNSATSTASAKRSSARSI